MLPPRYLKVDNILKVKIPGTREFCTCHIMFKYPVDWILKLFDKSI